MTTAIRERTRAPWTTPSAVPASSTPAPDLDGELAHAIREGLLAAPKRLPAALLYDDLGSTLFEAITMLPEYGVTKADLRLLEAHAADVVRRMGEPIHVVELGPGGGAKAKIFLEAALDLQPEIAFSAVDVSLAALETCRRTLEALPDVDVELVQATYLEGLSRVPRARAQRLVLFLGSNLSNFERSAARDFLRGVRERLEPGEALLLATDLEKPKHKLIAAYDDALGVTAAFDKNVLMRLNREWGANFDVASFEHLVRWSDAERRIEMHLRATRATSVRVGALELDVELAAGETIWTESSHRFHTDELRAWGEEAGFTCAAQWVDDAWPFAHTLLVAKRGASH
jgi:dimethylhistidine N-methyltransferase